MHSRSSVAGSALIMVLFIMTALVLYSTTVWHTTTYVIESMRARVEGEKNARFIDAVLQWGIAFSKTHYKQLIENRHEVELAFGPLPPRNKEHYQARVLLVPEDDIIKIRAELRSEKLAINSSCVVMHERINGVSIFSVRDRQWS
jgi:hypothetical protein